MQYLKHRYKSSFPTAFAGYICLIVGILVLLAWYSNKIGLFCIPNTLAPMHYEEAFNFSILGIAMLTLLLPYKRLSLFFALILSVGSIYNFSVYYLDLQLGPGNSFLSFCLSNNHFHPKHMNPNSAITFLTCGIAITLLSLKEASRLVYSTAMILCVGIFAFVFISLFFYLLNIPTSQELSILTPMPLHTAISFSFASSGLIFFIYAKHLAGRLDFPTTIPGLVTLAFMICSYLLLQLYLQEEKRHIYQLTLAESEKILQLITEGIEEQTTNLLSAILLWQTQSPLNENQWLQQADSLRSRNPNFQAIAWINDKFHVLRVTSANDQINKILTNESIQRHIHNSNSQDAGIGFSQILDLPSDKIGVLLCIPISQPSHARNFIVGLIDLNRLLNDLLNESIEKGFRITISTEGKTPLTFDLPRISYQSETYVKKRISLYNLNWTIEVWPSTHLVRRQAHYLPEAIPIIGLIIGILMAALIRSRQIAKTQTLELQANQAIIKEKLLEEKRHTQELQFLKDMANEFQTCSTLTEASMVVSKYCPLLLPAMAGELFLYNEMDNKLEPFSAWREESSHATTFSPFECKAIFHKKSSHISGIVQDQSCEHLRQDKDFIFVCLPLLTQESILGLLQIKAKEIQHNALLLAETIAHQLTLSLSSLKMRDLLRTQAIRDPLTHLFNRRYLHESLQRELHVADRNKQSVSIIMLDIDNFKGLNDTYGHDGGDVVIQEIASILISRSRQSDIACRYGGEEFILVLPDTPLNTATQRCEELRQIVATHHFSLQGLTLNSITISIGVAAYPENGPSMEHLISAADQALYAAKRAGRNRVEIATYD